MQFVTIAEWLAGALPCLDRVEQLTHHQLRPL